MKVYTGGYNDHQYDTAEFRKLVGALAAALPAIMEATRAESVVVQGKSGQSLAFGALMLIDFPLVVVRKNNEQSHGNQIEGRGILGPWLFLDDFVSSGDTLARVQETISLRSGCVTAPPCVGIIEASIRWPGDHTHGGIPRYWTHPDADIDGCKQFNTWRGRPVTMQGDQSRAVQHEPAKHYDRPSPGSFMQTLPKAFPGAFADNYLMR